MSVRYSRLSRVYNEYDRTIPTHSRIDNPYVDQVTKISGIEREKVDYGKLNAAAQKIQDNYHIYKNKKNFRTVQKPVLQEEGDDFIQRQLNLCERNGPTLELHNYSLMGWKEFYEPDDYFFTGFDKSKRGPVFENSVRVTNPDDPNNVTVYQGDMNIYNEKHGFGKLTTTKNVQLGTWREDQLTGWCINKKRKGHETEARYVNGDAQGKGYMYNSNGDVYRGDFVNSIKDGYGELNAKTFKYEGSFRNNKLDGKGKILFKETNDTYEGDFQNNQINGKGVFRWNNGDVYEGEMVNGKRTEGKYTFAKNNQVYIGEYAKDGQKEGMGKLIYSSGRVYQGEFIDGKPKEKPQPIVIVKENENVDIANVKVGADNIDNQYVQEEVKETRQLVPA